MSFFVSSDIKDLIDEKTYLSQNDFSNQISFCVKHENNILFSKNSFESISYNKKEDLKFIEFSLSLKEVENILFQKKTYVEINMFSKNYLLKLLKITKLEDNKYYCQYKVLGEKHD